MPCFTNSIVHTWTMRSTKTSEVETMKDYITNTLIQYKLISHHRPTCGLGNDGGNDGGGGNVGDILCDSITTASDMHSHVRHILNNPYILLTRHTSSYNGSYNGYTFIFK